MVSLALIMITTVAVMVKKRKTEGQPHLEQVMFLDSPENLPLKGIYLVHLLWNQKHHLHQVLKLPCIHVLLLAMVLLLLTVVLMLNVLGQIL